MPGIAAAGPTPARAPLRMAALALVWAASACGLAGCGPSAGAVGRESVLVVVNEASPVSVAIGEAWARRHRLGPEATVRIRVALRDARLRGAADETVSRSVFERQVRDPIARHLERHDPHGRVQVILTTRGVPLRIDAPAVPIATFLRDSLQASVDAELMLLGSGLDGAPGAIANPYFRSQRPFAEHRRRARRRGEAPLPRYLSARLTGRVREDDPADGVPASVRALLGAAHAPPHAGAPGADVTAARWLVDVDPGHRGALAAADRVLLPAAASALAALGLDVLTHDGPGLAADVDGIRGYASWGSNDSQAPPAPFYGRIGEHLVPGRFAPRSVAVDFVSTSARSFASPPRYGQSQVADLLALGAGGVGGHVFEPTLPAVHRPHLLLPRYALGATAVEAYWSSVPFLGWMHVWVGDPLMRLEDPRAVRSDDRDGDGIPDARDVCVLLPDPEQRDSDGDGFGNVCDADVDGDGLVTTSWGRTLPISERGDVEWIALTARSGHYDPDHDLDGDGAVDAVDVALAQLALLHSPGPSGVRSTH